MKRLRIAVAVLLAAICTLGASGCTATRYIYDKLLYNSGEEYNKDSSVLNGIDFTEDKSVYELDDDSKVTCLYLTVTEGKDTLLGKSYSFSYLNNYTDSTIEAGEEPYCDVIMKEGTENSSYGISLFGFGETTVNAKLSIRGNTTKIRPRSYQLKLYDRAGLWNNMKTINLYKNVGDLSRMKQKLCFDMLEGIDNIGSLRTGFVRLFVLDNTSPSSTDAYEDMGIYTFIEQPNKTYLKAHDLDTDGSLYKANNFDFSRREDALLDIDDENYDEAAFEEVLNIREATTHTKLLEMLDALNDESLPSDEVIEKYFNENNLLTYAAFNILVSNMSACTEDYLIYSPQNSNTWYLIPAGFSDAFENKVGKGDQVIPDGMIGTGLMQNSVLFRRYFSDSANLGKLRLKIDELREQITSQMITGMTDGYKKSILRYIYSIPEIQMLPRAAEYVEPYIDSFAGIYDENYDIYIENSRKPYPPYIISSQRTGESMTLTFSTDENAAVSYYAEVSSSATFDVIVSSSLATTENTILIEAMPDATCFVRIVAVSGSGEKQYSSNIFTDRRGDTYYGCVVSETEG